MMSLLYVSLKMGSLSNDAKRHQRMTVIVESYPDTLRQDWEHPQRLRYCWNDRITTFTYNPDYALTAPVDDNHQKNFLELGFKLEIDCNKSHLAQSGY